jgi:N-acetylglucosaminyldiphosphoundecaprenol N-acetyl-beta-D-mannosaminyltransferase
MTQIAEGVSSYRLLGLPVSVLDMPRAVAAIDAAIGARRGGYVCVRDAHGVMAAQADRHLMDIHENAFLVVPDGMPLVWFGRLYGNDMARVCGPDLMLELCRHAATRGRRQYFYGGTDESLAKLRPALEEKFPGLNMVGIESPPFRPVTTEPDPEGVARIRAADPDIVWVGLGSPKQEYWMRANAHLLPNSILIGVGAAFNFHAGTVRRAPVWMQRSGLEWLFRLLQEPKRTWRRYLVLAPQFLVLSSREYLGWLFGRRHSDGTAASGQ